MAFGVVEVPWGEFLRAIALEPELLVVRANVKKACSYPAHNAGPSGRLCARDRSPGVIWPLLKE